jgi:hypothetical protein
MNDEFMIGQFGHVRPNMEIDCNATGIVSYG